MFFYCKVCTKNTAWHTVYGDMHTLQVLLQKHKAGVYIYQLSTYPFALDYYSSIYKKKWKNLELIFNNIYYSKRFFFFHKISGSWTVSGRRDVWALVTLPRPRLLGLFTQGRGLIPWPQGGALTCDHSSTTCASKNTYDLVLLHSSSNVSEMLMKLRK